MPLLIYGTDPRGQSFYEVTSSINISSSGAYFALDQPIEVESELEVSVFLVAHGVNARFNAKARVVRRDAVSRYDLSGAALTTTNLAVHFLESLQHSPAA